MKIAFYTAAIVALVSTALVITRRSAAHAALYLIVSLLAVALIFFIAGAPLVAALEIVIYAGAIMVLLVFFIMTLNVTEKTGGDSAWLQPRAWIGPALLAALLAGELAYLLWITPGGPTRTRTIEPQEVSVALFGPYALAVELASFLLLAGLVGAYHLGAHFLRAIEKPDGEDASVAPREPTRTGTDRDANGGSSTERPGTAGEERP